jgi:predicted  nucleic acid-binding Zn-ribbon protein
VRDVVPYLSLLLILGGPTGFFVWLKYFQTRTGPKDQAYYETLIDTAWESADRIEAELDRERGRREQLQQELDKEQTRNLTRERYLRDELEKAKQNCRNLEREKQDALEEISSLRAAMRRWQENMGGEQPA